MYFLVDLQEGRQRTYKCLSVATPKPRKKIASTLNFYKNKYVQTLRTLTSIAQPAAPHMSHLSRAKGSAVTL